MCLPRAWAFAIAAITAVASASCAARVVPAPPTATPDGVRFVVRRAAATSVVVAGSFNGWSTSAHALTRSSADIWSAVVPLPPGEHLFMFVVDGTEWITPPLAEDYADDGFGSKNGVVVVRPPQ